MKTTTIMEDVLHVTRTARRLARALGAVAQQPLQDACGLTPKELMILRAFQGDSAHPHELSDRTDTAAPLVTRALDRLAELGYVERRPDTVDRRRVVVAVTEAGAAASAAGWAALEVALGRAFSDVPEGVLAQLVSDMEQLYRILEGEHLGPAGAAEGSA